MAMEDCGVLVQVLKHFCCKGGKQAFDGSDANLTLAANAYQDIRIARTKRILGSSHTLGKTQQSSSHTMHICTPAPEPLDSFF